jgi:PST family polysaccharide transporter
MAWTTAVVMLGRVTGFLTNLVVGWLLAPSEFGIYAVALGVSVIALTVRSVGIHRLLIQRGSEYDELAQPFARLSLYINLAAMLLLGLSGPVAAAYFRSPTITPLVWIIGLSMPLGVPAEILRSRLAIDLRFRAVALTNAVAMIATQAMTVIFALAGFGPFSFALPMAIGAALDSLMLVWLVGRWPAGRRLDWKLTRELTSSATWIVLCGFAAALIIHGSSLVVGRQFGPVLTGLYYFGAQLTSSVSIFFTTTMYRVLLPVLSRLASDPRRQGEAYLKSIGILATAAAPICGLAVVVGAPVIHVCWQGKWDGSIAVFQSLTTVLPIYIMTVIGSALLEARGLWRTNTLLYGTNSALTLAAAWLGTTIGEINAVAATVSVYRFGYSMGHGWFMMRLLERKPSEYLHAVLPPCLSCIAAAWLVIALIPDPFTGSAVARPAVDGTAAGLHAPWVAVTLMILAYSALVTAAYGLLMPARVAEFRKSVRALRRGGSSVADELHDND